MHKLQNITIKTPCYVIDEEKLIENGEILKDVSDRCGAKILLAQKAFSNYDTYPVIAPYLCGTESSGLYEAKLGAQQMPEKECHVFCGAYRDDEFDELLNYADHIVFNSPNQLKKFGKRAKDANKQIGLRINPEVSTQDGHDIYDPCAKKSRLGTTYATFIKEMTPELIDMLDGLHFHTLCEQNSDDLETTLKVFLDKFGTYLYKLSWLNMGGGHHITRKDYDKERLIRLVNHVKSTYNVDVYLEPGEAVALNAGYLCTMVLDIVDNNGDKIAILDMSAACHTPDVIEMPYRPPLYKGFLENEKPYTYRLGGPTCLSGDIIGDYSFEEPLKEGDLLIFEDMAIYSTCKNNTFNGMPLPNIWLLHKDQSLECLTDFGYDDFKYRLGKR